MNHGTQAMRRLLSLQLSVLLLAGMAAEAQVPNLPPDHFIKCEWNQVGVHPRIDASELTLLTACETQLQAQKRTVLAACLQPGAGAGPPRVIQACTESLDHDLLQGEARSLVLASRAQAYFVYGRLQQAGADYSSAIELTPHNAGLYYDRGLVAAAQRNYAGAVADEAQAIQFAPHLARAYFVRSVALGDLGNQAKAFNDLRTAVGLDPALAHYVVIKDKAVLLTLPPL
jgi:tetratricopeptide (TPR) repeat protein